MATHVKVRKWGNSLGVRLPKSFTSQKSISDGTMVEIDSLKIVDAKPRRRSRYKLKDILKNYCRAPKELDFPPVGKERWVSHHTYFPKRGDFIHMDASPSAGQEMAGPHFALVMSPLNYAKRTGMAIVLLATSKFKPETHPRFGNGKYIPQGMVKPTKANPSGDGMLLCDCVRQIDWRQRGAAFAGEAPTEFVEEALDLFLAVMEDDAD